MSLEGWAMIGLLAAGLVGGLLFWVKFGAQGGNDQ